MMISKQIYTPQPDSTQTILALDPSKSATGWVVYRSKTVIDWGCFKVRHEKPKKLRNALDTYWEFTTQYHEFLNQIIRKYWVTDICSEFGHGTQSYHAAVALEAVKHLITSFQFHTNIPVTFYTESECKKHHFGRSKNVAKSETVQDMSIKFEDCGFTAPNVKYEREAVCDALLVLSKHLDL